MPTNPNRRAALERALERGRRRARQARAAAKAAVEPLEPATPAVTPPVVATPPPAAAPAKAAPKLESKVTAESLAATRALTGDRLLVAPVFVLSSIRSGSTLLRVLLNANSTIHAPHELHLTGIKASARGRYAGKAMLELGLDDSGLQFLLWDRLLHREMVRHGKQYLVNKTPSDALMWRRIVTCWPDAKFIFLLRHPAAVADSWHRARKDWTRDHAAEDVLRYMVAVEDARTEHGGLTMRYEDITREPEREMRRACEFIGTDFEPAMLDYGDSPSNQGSFRAGLGDWSKQIKSGRVQPVETLPEPDDIPRPLIDISRTWDYLS